MTLADRLADAQQRSVALYLQRCALEQQRQQLAVQAVACDQALVRLDGEIELLMRLQTEGAI